MIAALNNSRSGILNNNLCAPFLAGCTDSIANNFNPLATADDSSCQYSCIDYSINILTDCWGEETSWSLSKGSEIIQSVAPNSMKIILYTYMICVLLKDAIHSALMIVMEMALVVLHTHHVTQMVTFISLIIIIT